jgi:hypothetical protein
MATRMPAHSNDENEDKDQLGYFCTMAVMCQGWNIVDNASMNYPRKLRGLACANAA